MSQNLPAESPPQDIPDLDLLNELEAEIYKVRNQPIGARSSLTIEQINYLCDRVQPIFASQPVLLELPAPITIVGDIHGQFHDLLRIFDNNKTPDKINYLFLGDYVDRGMNSIEVICLLFIYKIKYPDTFFMLRGNHECSYINRIYGFYDDCLMHYDHKIWTKFCSVFQFLPFAAIIEEKIFCVHGGISPYLKSLDDIRNVQRPIEVPEEGILCDLVWSDPSSDVPDWGENERGTSFSYGLAPVEQFLDKFEFDLICRAHQAIMDGYEFPFPDSQTLVTIFSAPNYCYEYENKGAILNVDENLFCNFTILEPMFWDTEDLMCQRPGTPPREGYDPEHKVDSISVTQT